MFQNFVMSVPNTQKNIAALRKLDFIMAIDVYLSETAAMADLVSYPFASRWLNLCTEVSRNTNLSWRWPGGLA